MFKKNEPLVPFSSRSTSSILIRSVSNSPAVAGSLKPWTWSWSTLRPRCPETMELCGFQDWFLTINLNCKTLAFNGALFWDYEFCLAGGLVCSMQYSIVLIRLDEKDLNWLCEIWRFACFTSLTDVELLFYCFEFKITYRLAASIVSNN